MRKQPTVSSRACQVPAPTNEHKAMISRIARVFSEEVVDGLRKSSGYNERLRVATAQRLLLTVVEAFCLGCTLAFAPLRAVFLARFGNIQKCPFRNRFTDKNAPGFFRQALLYFVLTVVGDSKQVLTGPLDCFDDVQVYDCTSQRVPARGRERMPSCAKGKAGAKVLMAYSLKTGTIVDGLCAAQKTSDRKLWRTLVGKLVPNVLYLMDLGFFCKGVFSDALAARAHVLMRLKGKVKLKVVAHMTQKGYVQLPAWSLGTYLKTVPKRKGTLYDLDIVWTCEKMPVVLRLVGYVHCRKQIRWYVTTAERDLLSADQVVQAYRLRWHVELLFRELKQGADLGRADTADPNAIAALNYGAMLGHALLRSIRIVASISQQIPIEELRPLACAAIVKAFVRSIFDALLEPSTSALEKVNEVISGVIAYGARERSPSRSRARIALELGAVGA